MRGGRRARNIAQLMFLSRGLGLGRRELMSPMKTNEHLLKEITAVMADAWLAACDRRVIAPEIDGKKFIVVDMRGDGHVVLFGPAPADACQLLVHRMAALDVLLSVGAASIVGAAGIAVGNGALHAG